jgi:hypothetical protein
MPMTWSCGTAKRLVGCSLAMLTICVGGVAQYGIRPGGESVAKLAKPGTKTVALFFVASDCPISDRTFPEMKRIREEFNPRGVAVWFVYPNSTERPADVEKHQRDFDMGGQVLLDPKGELARLTQAKVTPEVSVLVPAKAGGWRLVYTGRVDDRYVHLGLERPQIREHFAEEALDAVLAGKPVPKATGTPVGCGIIPPMIPSEAER